MKNLSLNIFDDANKLLFHHANSGGRSVSSTVLNPYETVRSLFKQHGIRLDSTEASVPTGKKVVYRHYPSNKVSIVLLIADWEEGRPYADDKACKGLIELVYYVMLMFGGQETDFCTSDQRKSQQIAEAMRATRGIVGPFLDSFPDLGGAPLALITQSCRVARVSRQVYQRFRAFFNACETRDDTHIVACAVLHGSSVVAMSEIYSVQVGMDAALLRYALPLAVAQQPPATMRDLPFFGLSEGKVRACTVLLRGDMQLLMLCQVEAPGIEDIVAGLQQRGLLGVLSEALDGYESGSGFEAKQAMPLPREVREVCLAYLPSVKAMYLEKDAGTEDWWACGRRDHGGGNGWPESTSRQLGARMPYHILKANENGPPSPDVPGGVYATLLSHIAELLTLPLPCHFGSPVSAPSGHFTTRDGQLCVWSAAEDLSVAWGGGDPPTRVVISLLQRSASACVSLASKRHAEVMDLLLRQKKTLRDTLSL